MGELREVKSRPNKAPLDRVMKAPTKGVLIASIKVRRLGLLSAISRHKFDTRVIFIRAWASSNGTDIFGDFRASSKILASTSFESLLIGFNWLR